MKNCKRQTDNLCCKAHTEDEAKQKVKECYDDCPPPIEWRFVEERPADWVPFNSRFKAMRNMERRRGNENTLPSVRVAGVTVGVLIRASRHAGVSGPWRLTTAKESGHTVAASPVRGCGCASLLKAAKSQTNALALSTSAHGT